MNVNKILLVVFILNFTISFSQEKKDVYFILEEVNSEYAFNKIMFDRKIGFINLYNKEEYEYHQKKVKEAKDKGEYYFDPNSGRDNLNIKVSKLTFEIISIEKSLVPKCEKKKLNLVDYNWILSNSWKKIAQQHIDFKDIYFLYETKKDYYQLFKVEVTIVSH